MQIYKFGGASVKDAEGVRNLANTLKSVGYKNTLIIVSAMGKTTNAMEKVISNYFDARHELNSSVQEVKKYHNHILLDLFENETHDVFENIDSLFQKLLQFFDHNKSPDYNFVYDQVIAFGELISTSIISHYLNSIGLTNSWLDVRNYIKTDDYYRSAKVNWNQTQELISKKVDTSKLNITQGFIGSNSNNFTTTLGREGSDYTAAIFAFCLNAKSVTIWKDVPGVLNADPRYFENAELLSQISYTEAIELSYYGASVIHPKTLQPLQRKEIPLLVKSFLNPENDGSVVGKDLELTPKIPCYILKQNQTLISVSSLDLRLLIISSNLDKKLIFVNLSSSKQLTVPLWHTGPFGKTLISNVSLSQSIIIVTSCKKLPLVSPFVQILFLERLKKVTRPVLFVIFNASSFIYPSIRT